MALFNRRKKEKDALPEEVRDYYQTERRERTGRAWLLAILTLLVTFLIAAALFFGGRWLYRAIFDNNDDSNTTQVEEVDGSQSADSTENTETENTDNSGDSTEEGDESSASENSGHTSSTNTDSSNGSTAGAVTTTPNTGPDELVNTGPGDEL